MESLCTSSELYSYYYRNAIFLKNQEELKQVFFAGIKIRYFSNIVPGLFCPSSTISTFPEGLHLCMSFGLYSYHYTNEVFQKNQEELETSFLWRKRQNLLILNTFEKLTMFNFKFLLISSLGFSGMLS